jgi:hypothetical protein
MESYLKENFGAVQAKHSSEEALGRWRKLVGVVKNPKRRFRFTANLDKRSEATAMKKNNHVRTCGPVPPLRPPDLCSLSFPCFSSAGSCSCSCSCSEDRSSNFNVHSNVSAVLAKISSYLILPCSCSADCISN